MPRFSCTLDVAVVLCLAGSERVPSSAADAATSLQAAAPHAEAVDIDLADNQKQCKDDLQKVLAETMAKIAEIDRRLLDVGPAPAWRDAMNEVFETAMEVSRTLDYAPDEPRPAAARRRGL